MFRKQSVRKRVKARFMLENLLLGSGGARVRVSKGAAGIQSEGDQLRI